MITKQQAQSILGPLYAVDHHISKNRLQKRLDTCCPHISINNLIEEGWIEYCPPRTYTNIINGIREDGYYIVTDKALTELRLKY